VFIVCIFGTVSSCIFIVLFLCALFASCPKDRADVTEIPSSPDLKADTEIVPESNAMGAECAPLVSL
jgi:hypothetical protein